MKKVFALIVVIVLIFSGCSSVFKLQGQAILNDDVSSSAETTQQVTLEPTSTPEITSTTTPELTATLTPGPLPTKPKYIFYLIGDGLGYAQLLLGNVYEKLLYKDWEHETLWDGFLQQKLVKACGESAGGGTALATGYVTKPGKIAQTPDGEKLYTIMDRAKDNGYATGVISNSSLTDATPATFSAHAVGRFKFTTIAQGMAYSGIDFLAGGGMQHILFKETAKQWGTIDTASRPVSFEGSKYTLPHFINQGYTTYWGLEGTEEYNNTLDSYNVNDGDKILVMFEATNLLFQSYKYKRQRVETCALEPDLDEIAQDAIDFLSKDDDGFVLMVEQAHIDKAGHYNDLSVIAQETHVLHKTLETIFKFYNEHPDETLIIMSADHECGYFTYTDEGYETIINLPTIEWQDVDYKELSDFLVKECDIYISLSKLRNFIETGEMNLWGDDDEDYALVHGIIAEALCKRYGIYARSDKHSNLPVPCYTHGLKAEVFAEAEHISDIPSLICEIMGWESLPDIAE